MLVMEVDEVGAVHVIVGASGCIRYPVSHPDCSAIIQRRDTKLLELPLRERVIYTSG